VSRIQHAITSTAVGSVILAAAAISAALVMGARSLSAADPAKPAQPLDFAFLALAHARLGQPDEAADAFEEAARLMQETSAGDSEESRNMIREVKETLESLGAGTA